MILSVFASTQSEKIHLQHTCSARSTITCGSIEIAAGTKGEIKDVCTRLDGIRFSVLWEGQASAIWCSETEVIECVPEGPD